MSDLAHKIWVKVKGERFLVEVSDLNQRPIIAIVEGTLFEIYPETGIDEEGSENDHQDPLLHTPETISASPGIGK